MDKELLRNKFEAGRNAIRKAVDFQISFLQTDGGYIWEGYVKDAYHKQAYSWSLVGKRDEAHRLLTWVRDNTLLPDGQLKDYNGDVYKHAWICQSAHSLSRFDISYPVYKFLLTCQAPCGGFPLLKTHELVRAMTTAWVGITAIMMGDMETADKAVKCCISMLEQQPEQNKFYFQMTKDGKLCTDGEYIDTAKTKQCYWEVGFSMLLMDRMYQITKDKKYLEYARQYFEFFLRCSEDVWTYWGSGKGALAAAIYYTFTGDKRALEGAVKFIDFVVETQDPCGGFQYEDEEDILLIYIDHAACFSGWVLESISYIESKLQTM